MPKIGIVVPNLEGGGGVPTVAEFLCEVIDNSTEFHFKLVSLAVSWRDECSIRLTRPSSWFQGITTRNGEWNGRPYIHVGSTWVELEFMRFRPRQVLSSVLDDCDLIQVVSGNPAWALSVMGEGRPVVAQVATLAANERKAKARMESGAIGAWRYLMTFITSKFDGLALRRVQAVMVENYWMYEHTKSTSTGIVRLAPPGVNANVFKPPIPSPESLNRQKYILAVGRLDDPRKNMIMLLEAFALMRNDLKESPLLQLAGATDPGQVFWSRVSSLGLSSDVRFHLSPDREELIAYYQNASCLGLTSFEEGFGMVIIEAMSCGVPVVATRCGGPEIIISEGIDGFLVDIGDIQSFADRLGLLIKNNARSVKMGAAARRKVVQKFDRSVSGKEFLSVYRDLLATGSGEK